MDNVIEYSENIKRQADELLQATNLLEVLESFGEVHIGGAYELGLMYDPDIDVRVYCENPREASIKALADLVSQRNFQKYQYGDFQKFKRENRPESFIVVLIVPFENLKWEIEIWFYAKNENRTDQLIESLKAQLTPKMKVEILEAKQKRHKEGISKHELSSIEIYETVLKNNQ